MNEIDFIGYDATHPKDFFFNVPEGHDCYLLLLVATPCEFLINNELITVSSSSAILYSPGYKIYYRATCDEYQNDWIRFYTDEAFVEQFPLQNMPFSVTDFEYCHNLIKLLTWESALTSANSEASISHLLRVLFSKLHESYSSNLISAHTPALVTLHKQIYNNPQFPWNIHQMAAELHLSTSRLHTLYKKMFGSSCMDDVIEGRIRIAQDRLKYTAKSIREIAEDCGYNNVEHFCRQFKQYKECTPGQYRRLAALGTSAGTQSHATLGGSEISKPKAAHSTFSPGADCR